MRILNTINEWWKRTIGAKEPVELPNAVLGRPRLQVDIAEIVRLSGLGWSPRRIAKHLDLTRDTVRRRLAEWRASQPEDVPVPDPPRAVAAEEPKRPAEAVGPIEMPTVLPEAFQGAISGLTKPAPAVRQPKPAEASEVDEVEELEPENETADEVEPVQPIEEATVPFRFLVANQTDCERAWAYRLPAMVWSGAQAPELRNVRRIYVVVPDEAVRAGIVEALRKSPIASRVRVCVGQTEALFMVGRRELAAERGDFRDFAAFERFANIRPPAEPPKLIARPEPCVRGSGYVADTPWPNSALQ